MMEELARKYARNHCGRVSHVEDYRFKFDELDPKHPDEVKRSYWVMESYFYEPKRPKKYDADSYDYAIATGEVE